MSEKLSITGTVKKIIYKNDQNGYSVLILKEENGKRHTVTGIFFKLSEEDVITVYGKFTEHATYGTQFATDYYEMFIPKNANALKEYLSKGMVKNIGPVLADRLISKFGNDTLDIMTNHPEKLSEIEGIGKRKAELISRSLEERTVIQKAMIFLAEYGIPQGTGMKIYKHYKDRMYEIIQKYPYQVADEIKGIGFLTMDKIALENGVSVNADLRIKSGIKYVLEMANSSGHVCFPTERVIKQAISLLNVEKDLIQDTVNVMLKSGALIEVNLKGELCLYRKSEYMTECKVAELILKFNKKRKKYPIRFGNTKLDDIQKSAVETANKNGFMILTGGPGTGKSTTTNLIIRHFLDQHKNVALAAPTGRAAKRMQEVTGKTASTIHRLLGATPDGFEYNQDNRLGDDIYIVDEVSMLDMSLMHSFLRALPDHARVILVGDKNQLPSVGAGNILADIIHSGICPVVELTKIYRQADGSEIIENAHHILRNEPLNITNRKDFFFKYIEDPIQIKQAILHYVSESLPNFTGETEIQVLAPVKERFLGIKELNLSLQETLNPGGELVLGFRKGDKIIQTKNNYKLERVYPNGKKVLGVYNGDMGYIERIDSDQQYIYVRYEDDSLVTYDFKEADEIMLSYALTIHKSQGSEYPVVVMPIYDYIPMLTTMNLLYTAITRAKKFIMLIGSKKVLTQMIRNVKQAERYTGLSEHIANLCEKDCS